MKRILALLILTAATCYGQRAGWDSKKWGVDAWGTGQWGAGPWTSSVVAPPGWVSVPEQTVTAAAEVEITFIAGAEQLTTNWDLTTSVDGATVSVAWKIGETWYTQDATHNNLSLSSAATYGGSVAQDIGTVGNAAGEGTSGSLFLAGLTSTTLYPTALLGGGTVTDAGAVSMTQGALARKTAGVITAIKLTPSAGTISGTLRAYYYTP